MPTLCLIISPLAENHEGHKPYVEGVQERVWESSDNESITDKLKNAIHESNFI